MTDPIIMIVGRPNAGKSIIFNHIAGVRVSTVRDIPSVTHDRTYTTGEQSGRGFSTIDTDGIDLSDEPSMDQIKHQAEIVIDEANVIIFVASDREGVTDTNELVAKILYRSNKSVILAVNKVDNPEMHNDIYEPYALGPGDPFPVSGSHGSGIGDVLDETVEHFPNTPEGKDEDIIKFNLIGCPNVGRSSLISAILGEDRVIVPDIEETTRDAIGTHFESGEGQKFLAADTTGAHRHGKAYKSTEEYSVTRAMQAIECSDIVLTVLNAEESIREQDKRAAGHAHEAGRSTIIVVSEWDTVRKNTNTVYDFEAEIRDKFQYLDYAPVIFVSALTKQRLNKLPELIETINVNQNLRVPSALLNDAVIDTVTTSPAPTDKEKRSKVFCATWMTVKPPTFVIFINKEELIHFSYARFLENQIGKVLTFGGTPVKIIPRRRG